MEACMQKSQQAKGVVWAWHRKARHLGQSPQKMVKPLLCALHAFVIYHGSCLIPGSCYFIGSLQWAPTLLHTCPLLHMLPTLSDNISYNTDLTKLQICWNVSTRDLTRSSLDSWAWPTSLPWPGRCFLLSFHLESQYTQDPRSQRKASFLCSSPDDEAPAWGQRNCI